MIVSSEEHCAFLAAVFMDTPVIVTKTEQLRGDPSADWLF